MKFMCEDCQSEHYILPKNILCSCGGLLDLTHNLRKLDGERLKHLFHQRLSERMTIHSSGVWRYKELIAPEMEDRFIVSKLEGNTGLYLSELSELSRYAGIRKVWLKAQSENPSGSFKDNGMTAAVSYGLSLGCSRYACASTGNTSSSLAMYAALSNVSSYVFVPREQISINKVLQTAAYGAKVITFEGTYDDAISFLKINSEQLGLYVCNSINPMRIEGQKSMIYEIAQSMNWKLPDWIIIPGGALSNVSALGKGLEELHGLGMITELPRIALVQAEGASPFHRMMTSGKIQFTAEPNPRTRATAMNIGNPPSWRKALRALALTNGVTVSVTDEEIFNAKAMVDRSGIGCEPASASTIAGLRKLTADKTIDHRETAVCILTGHILKDTEALNEYHFTINPKAHAPFANPICPGELTHDSISRIMQP